jgi:DNA replication and repair protein RecF
MLESVYVCSLLRSPRTTKDKELIRMGASRAKVAITVEKKFRKHTILLLIDEVGKKKVAIDGIPVTRAGELLGVLGVVFFSPDELKLVKESPAERRSFLDVGLSQQQKSYFTALQKYNKTLKQKNNLLKESKHADNLDDMLDVWDIGLAEHGATIIRKRMEYVNELNKFASQSHGKISSGKEKLTLSYETAVNTDGDIRRNLEDALLASRAKDKELGYSTVGPHRDDIKIEIDGIDARRFASQGQQRTIALAMKLGEVEMYKQETGETPVLLLDDVLSELDKTRRDILLEATNGVQTILTCTEFDGEGAKLFEVKEGKIVSKQ